MDLRGEEGHFREYAFTTMQLPFYFLKASLFGDAFRRGGAGRASAEMTGQRLTGNSPNSVRFSIIHAPFAKEVI